MPSRLNNELIIKVELDKLLAQIRKHHILIVYKLDRLGRLLKYLLKLIGNLFDENRLDCKVVIMPLTPPHQRGVIFTIFQLSLQDSSEI